MRTILPFVSKTIGSCVGENNHGLEVRSLLGSHKGIGHDYDHIARLGLSRGSSIEADDTTALFTGNNVCIKTLAIIIIHDPDPLAFEYTRSLEKQGIDSDASYIVQIRLSHCDTVNL